MIPLDPRHPHNDPMKPLNGFLRKIHVDIMLLLGLVALSVVGLVILYSASGQDMATIQRQLIRLTVAFSLMFLVAQIHPNQMKIWAPWLFIAGLGLLFAVLAVGAVGKGAQRWLCLGSVCFQPSEVMKLLVPLIVSWYLSERPMPPDPRRIVISSAMIIVPTVLIILQPDLGTSLLIASSGFFVLFLAGLSLRLISFTAVMIVPMAWIFWEYFMHSYQKQRVLTFLDPEKDPLGAGYHIIQSKIAIGSGGTYGKGWLNGTQSNLEFLPERATDFIFAVIGEEFGLLGLLLLLLLYCLIIMRGLFIAFEAKDSFTRLLAGSLSLTFFVYVLVNAGMVTGMLPVVGLPLPLISYGGTSMVTLMVSFGILMSIHTHRKLLAK